MVRVGHILTGWYSQQSWSSRRWCFRQRTPQFAWAVSRHTVMPRARMVQMNAGAAQRHVVAQRRHGHVGRKCEESVKICDLWYYHILPYINYPRLSIQVISSYDIAYPHLSIPIICYHQIWHDLMHVLIQHSRYQSVGPCNFIQLAVAQCTLPQPQEMAHPGRWLAGKAFWDWAAVEKLGVFVTV